MQWMHGFNLKVNAWLNHTIVFKELSVSSLNSWNKIRLKFWKWILTFSFFLFLVNENDFIGKLHHFHSILLNFFEDWRFIVFLFVVAFLNVDDVLDNCRKCKIWFHLSCHFYGWTCHFWHCGMLPLQVRNLIDENHKETWRIMTFNDCRLNPN